MTDEKREGIMERAVKSREPDPPFARVSARKAEAMLDAVGFFELLEAAERVCVYLEGDGLCEATSQLLAACEKAKGGR